MKNNWLRGELCVMWWPRWSKNKEKEAAEAAERDKRERGHDAQRLNRATTQRTTT